MKYVAILAALRLKCNVLPFVLSSAARFVGLGAGERAMGQACSRRAPILRIVALSAEQSAKATFNWYRFVKSCLSLRKLQRVFAYSGHHLKLFPARLRLRIANKWPQQ